MPLIPTKKPPMAPMPKRGSVGALRAPTPGRSDVLAVDTQPGAYVLPADVVAGIGHGNSDAGMATLDKMFKAPSAPSPAAPVLPKRHKFIPRPPKRPMPAFAVGGDIDMDGDMMPSDTDLDGEKPTAQIAAAGGEYIVPAEKVAELGGGSLERGNAILAALVAKIRGETIRDLSSMPPPKA